VFGVRQIARNDRADIVHPAVRLQGIGHALKCRGRSSRPCHVREPRMVREHYRWKRCHLMSETVEHRDECAKANVAPGDE
jgi:hypothetical protein